MNRRKYEIEDSEGGRRTKEKELRTEFLIPPQHRKDHAISINFRLAHQSEVDKNYYRVFA
jgi:hypothetical protein